MEKGLAGLRVAMNNNSMVVCKYNKEISAKMPFICIALKRLQRKSMKILRKRSSCFSHPKSERWA
ncbi:unnamed protein product [Arabidopsis halleri]